MMLKHRRIIGLEINENNIIVTELLKKQGQIYFSNYKIVSHFKEIAVSLFKEHSVVIPISTQVLLFRSFLLGPSILKLKDTRQEMDAFLKRQSLPLRLEECFWNTFRLNGNLNLVAAKKEVVEKFLAQIGQAGFNVVGVIPSFLALYNLIIYNYGQKENFSLLHIYETYTDLLIFEKKRIWVYPLPVGRQSLKDNLDSQNLLLQEIQRTLNIHYSQNPPTLQRKNNYLYLSGTDYPESLLNSLKRVFINYEMINLEPLKRINCLNPPAPEALKMLNLSLGLGLTFLETPGTLNANIIKERIKKERTLVRTNLFSKVSRYGAFLAVFCLLFLVIKLSKDLRLEGSVFKTTQWQVAHLLPEAKALKAEKEKLQKLAEFLKEKLNQQNLYLKALGVIAENKSPFIQIKELEAKAKDNSAEVVLSISAPSYEEVNEFLTKLKKNQALKEVEVISSSLPGEEPAQSSVDFKLRFQITYCSTD